MLTINVRLLLALPIYLLAALTMLAMLATGVSGIIGLVHLDPLRVLASTIVGGIIAAIGGALVMLAGAIHGTGRQTTAA